MPYRLLLLVLILVLAGCAPQAAPAPAVPTPTPAPANTATAPVAVATMQPMPTATVTPELPAPTEAPTATPEGGGALQDPGALNGPVQTYTNSTAHFAMDFPATWTIIDISQQVDVTRMYTVSANSFDPNKPRGPKQQEGLQPGESKMDISVNPSEQPMTYENALVYWRASILGGEFPARILDEKSGTLPSGLRATRWIVQSERSDPVVWTLVEINDNIINFVGMGDLSLVDKITWTVRAAE